MNPVTQLLEAARFLTRIPLPQTGRERVELSDTFLMFPVVGIFIGAFSAVTLWLGLSVGLPPFLAAVVAVGATVLLTGGLHEDGLADIADGFGGGHSRDEKLRIMRDSHLGSYGVLCLVLMLAARLGVFANLIDRLPPLSVVYLLIASAALSRGMMVGLVTILPPARHDGLSASLRPATPLFAMAAYAVALVIAVMFLLAVVSGLNIAVIISTTLIATIIVAALAFRQIGGHTGDVAGAGQQLSEITCLFAIVAVV